MNTEDIQKEWDIDCQIDRTNLIAESIKIPELHSKYYKYYLVETKNLKILQESYKKLEYYKWLYYQGKMGKQDLDKFGWEQFDLKILKSDIQKVIDSDEELTQRRLAIGEQQDKVDFVKAVITNLNNRSFLIGHAIEMLKFEHGIS